MTDVKLWLLYSNTENYLTVYKKRAQTCLKILSTKWFGLVSLFNGISTFVGYLIPKRFSKKNSSDTI